MIHLLAHAPAWAALLITMLAGQRWAVLIVEDSIGDAARERLFLRIPVDIVYAQHHRDRTDPSGWRWIDPKDRTPRTVHPMFAKLMSCTWCMSLWTTIAVVASWNVPWTPLQVTIRTAHLVAAMHLAGFVLTTRHLSDDPPKETT